MNPRNMDAACLRALRNWTAKGPPRDPVAWLIMVGRNATLDQKRKTSRLTALPDEIRAAYLEHLRQVKSAVKISAISSPE